MSFDVRILDGRTSFAPPRASGSRRARVARACVGLARLAFAGESDWRRAVRQTLLTVGRMLVEVLEDCPAPAPSQIHAASAPVSTPDACSETEPKGIEKPRTDEAWAVWM